MRTPAIRLDFWLQIWPQPASLLTSARASSPESLKVKIFVEFNYLKKFQSKYQGAQKSWGGEGSSAAVGRRGSSSNWKGKVGDFWSDWSDAKSCFSIKRKARDLSLTEWPEWKLTTILLRQDRRKTEALEQTLLELTGEVDNYKWVQQLYMLYKNSW